MSSPLHPSSSAANRGLGNLTRRKRSREPDDDNSSAPPPSSPPPSSPPILPLDDAIENDLDEEAEYIGDVDDIDEMAEDEDGIDLFADTFERDYRPRDPEAYEGDDIDDTGDYEELDLATRRQLEARLNRRDRELARRRRVPPAFLQDDDDDGNIDLTRQPRRRRHHYDEEVDEMDMDIMDEEMTLEALAEIKAANVTEWVTQPSAHRSIYREFKAFLTEFTDKDGTSVYGTRIRNLGEINAESLEVSLSPDS
ncbi:DNA replication licensing factor mcm2 [Histoplasma capsulatum H143]|uniref:DNA replication licensing factor mcm2 n=1 Tax=Ajellomyces capsulatus (strain H143) TaxID=544712 RepID=C6HMZ6_AJECH|nr:DNA replication licensing factor mcm2 [Histoplasma capsulatum H143]